MHQSIFIKKILNLNHSNPLYIMAENLSKHCELSANTLSTVVGMLMERGGHDITKKEGVHLHTHTETKQGYSDLEGARNSGGFPAKQSNFEKLHVAEGNVFFNSKDANVDDVELENSFMGDNLILKGGSQKLKLLLSVSSDTCSLGEYGDNKLSDSGSLLDISDSSAIIIDEIEKELGERGEVVTSGVMNEEVIINESESMVEDDRKSVTKMEDGKKENVSNSGDSVCTINETILEEVKDNLDGGVYFHYYSIMI